MCSGTSERAVAPAPTHGLPGERRHAGERSRQAIAASVTPRAAKRAVCAAFDQQVSHLRLRQPPELPTQGLADIPPALIEHQRPGANSISERRCLWQRAAAPG